MTQNQSPSRLLSFVVSVRLSWHPAATRGPPRTAEKGWFSGCGRSRECSERSGAMACRNKPWRQFIHASRGKQLGFHAHLPLQHTISFAFPSREPRAPRDENRERVHARPCSQDVLSHLGTFLHRALNALFLSSLGCETTPGICRAGSLPARCWPKVRGGSCGAAPQLHCWVILHLCS